MALKIAELLALGREGWRPYGVEPQAFVYERLRCTRHKARCGRPNWLYKGDIFLCVGCDVRCLLARPEGFTPTLPIRYPVPEIPYTLSPLELASRKHVLGVDEVAYCLNVSHSTVYRWIETGKLIALRDKPVRIKSSCVLDLMNDFDE